MQEEGNTTVSDNLPKGTNTSGKRNIMKRYMSLLDVNSDLVGWVSVPGTIMIILLYRPTTMIFTSDGISISRLPAGAIFMDYRSDSKGQGRHTILYGHHMRNGTMFKELEKYKNAEFFEQNGYVRFDTLFAEIEWEVFSVYITDTTFPYIQVSFSSDEEYVDFIKRIQNKSIYQKDIELNAEDQILTLSTCTYEYDDARFVVHARRIVN